MIESEAKMSKFFLFTLSLSHYAACRVPRLAAVVIDDIGLIKARVE